MAEENATLYAYGVPVSNQNNSAKDMLINIPNLDADNVEDGLQTLNNNLSDVGTSELMAQTYVTNENLPIPNITNYRFIMCKVIGDFGCTYTLIPALELRKAISTDRRWVTGIYLAPDHQYRAFVSYITDTLISVIVDGQARNVEFYGIK